jgi:predicted N-formylglutamate amidohydrolase
MTNATTAALLGQDDPKPVEVDGGDGASPFVLICDHAGNLLPRSLGSLGLSAVARQTHIAWDIGAAALARRLARLLDATVVTQPYSRLVIDCNRPLGAFDSIATESASTIIPANQDLRSTDVDARQRAIFHPYHDTIRGHLDARVLVQRSTVIVTVHSFTPVFSGVVRPWHVGVLFNRDARLAEILMPLLRDEPGLVVGCNEPYAASDASDYSLIQHGEHRDVPCVELEVRQDLIADERGQTVWAERLARLLLTATDRFHL